MSVGIATISPRKVVTSAFEMPSARSDGVTAAPRFAIVWKASIMPLTVPNRPIMGAMLAMRDR